MWPFKSHLYITRFAFKGKHEISCKWPSLFSVTSGKKVRSHFIVTSRQPSPITASNHTLTYSTEPDENPVLQPHYAADYLVSITTDTCFQQLDTAVSIIKWMRLICTSPRTSSPPSWQQTKTVFFFLCVGVCVCTEPSLEAFNVYVSILLSPACTLSWEFPSSQITPNLSGLYSTLIGVKYFIATCAVIDSERWFCVDFFSLPFLLKLFMYKV